MGGCREYPVILCPEPIGWGSDSRPRVRNDRDCRFREKNRLHARTHSRELRRFSEVGWKHVDLQVGGSPPWRSTLLLWTDRRQTDAISGRKYIDGNCTRKTAGQRRPWFC